MAGVEEATAGMRARADTVESDLTGLVDQLRTMVESLVESVRSSAGSLESELASIHAGLAEVREAQPLPEPEAALELQLEAEVGADADILAADQPTAEHAVEASYDEVAAGPDEQEVDFNEPDPGVGDEGGLETTEDAKPVAAGGDSAEGARLIALNMALNGTPREETERYLEENFELGDSAALLDEVDAD